MNKMNYLMILALGLGLTHRSYAEEKNLVESLTEMDEKNTLRNRLKKVIQHIDDQNLFQKLFLRVMNNPKIEKETTDDEKESVQKTLRTIDQKNAIRKRLRLIAKYVDKHDLLKTTIFTAYHNNGKIDESQIEKLSSFLSKSKKEMKKMVELEGESLKSEPKHAHDNLSAKEVASKIDKSNALRKIMKSLITVVDDKNLLQKFFDGIMKESNVSEEDRTIFLDVLKKVDDNNLLRAECKRAAKLIDENDYLKKFFNTTFKQADEDGNSVSDKAKATITAIFEGKLNEGKLNRKNTSE